LRLDDLAKMRMPDSPSAAEQVGEDQVADAEPEQVAASRSSASGRVEAVDVERTDISAVTHRPGCRASDRMYSPGTAALFAVSGATMPS